MRRFFINPEELEKNRPRVTGPDVKHMKKVLRLTSGDRISLIDGTGYEYVAEIRELSQDAALVEIVSRQWSLSESPLELTVCQGFLKDKKMDDLVRHLTELGMSRWIPVLCERAVARPDPRRMTERIKRWETIAIEALKQCGRAKPPEISDLMTLSELFEMKKVFDRRYLFWENEETPLDDPETGGSKKILILLGPEGGFSEREVADAQLAGFTSVSLGPRILRAETAALAASALIQYLFGDIKKKP